MWKEVPRTRKKEVLSSHLVESSRPSLTTVRLEVPLDYFCMKTIPIQLFYVQPNFCNSLMCIDPNYREGLLELN